MSVSKVQSHSNAHQFEPHLTRRHPLFRSQQGSLSRMLGVTNGPLLVNSDHGNFLCSVRLLQMTCDRSPFRWDVLVF